MILLITLKGRRLQYHGIPIGSKKDRKLKISTSHRGESKVYEIIKIDAIASLLSKHTEYLSNVIIWNHYLG